VDRFGGWNARWAGVPAILTRRVDSTELKALAHFKYKPYAAIIAISRAIEAQLKDHVGLSPERVHYVASGVDTDRYRPTETRGRLAEVFGLSADTVKIGVVAQLISRKGHEQLFSVLPELIAEHPKVDVLCFGQGPLRRELEDQIRSLALTAHVRLVGFRDDLIELLPELDCLVHPARREGLGVAVLEALSCRVPVVITAVGGLVDIVEHDVNGLLVAPDDDRALLAALRRIVQQPALRKRLGAAGRRRVEEAFSVDTMTRGNLAVYEQVMKGDDDSS
jgi:glycosyltransferase involved in cell wall biosynthesis